VAPIIFGLADVFNYVIRHNLAWTLVILGYLIIIALFYRGVLPTAMRP
jgi:hypothetical protein